MRNAPSPHQQTRTTPSRVVQATPSQLFHGDVVEYESTRVTCTTCKRELQERTPVTARAYRLVDAIEWVVPRVYCGECAPTALTTPTLGAVDMLLTGILSVLAREQTHRLCLTEIEPIAYSPPTDGEPL
ncbi:hypothetical protein [Halorubrum sp. N11]|uniref:hypothetical protein n=1 Tax=Halorubrum sp. N11 TaxID=3402276 RepID=UPI003EC0FBE9